ncbi:hypothetical protein A1O7_08266 [Cladophialophora yegresii CBS 114405]|uniref:RING-type domain-containing protein n=1 Tax=Cladophialophora yegresii CBS 114405 TaxID=1182544 RepID=W9W9X7_9EURO|nr:uncharacterized protein A1O7_08266 [Cladophialophora yegresii CBS 114405]EXJ55339.1 hypothetical protein A1O7_08266 [Cladophialophora yegresii CBS 114405]
MSYEPMGPGWKEIPRELDELPNTTVYRSPRRVRETLEERNEPVIEVSDDDEAVVGQPVQLPLAQQIPAEAGREVVTIDSSSDADGSDMDVVILPPGPSHKRPRPDGSSQDGSPQPPPTRASMKRRAPSVDTPTVMDPAPLQVRPILQHRRDVLASDLQNQQYAWPPTFKLPGATPIASGPSYTTHHKSQPSKQKEEPIEPPYYVDSRLEVKMYRGPGYERFPVALGTVQGHQELCDKWDADLITRREQRLAKLQREQKMGYTTYDVNSSSDDDVAVEHSAAFEKRCLDSLLEVFPDIERAFIQKKIREERPKSRHVEDDADDDLIVLGPPPLAEKIISEIVEMQSYPKERAATASKTSSAIDGTGITITWNRELPKDDMYLKDATILVAKHFPHVPTHFVDEMVKEKKSIFDTYVAIHELEDQYYTVHLKPYPRRKQPRPDIEKKYLLRAKDHRIPREYANRVNELQAAKQYVMREEIKEAARKAKEEAEALNLAEHIQSGAIIECQCCYDAQVPLNRVVPCTAEVPHNFCFMCVEGLADTQVGMLQHEMLCMDDSGCEAQLSHEDIGRAIPITTFDRLELNQQQAEIMAANIEGLEQCPCCDYKAICGDIKEEPVYFCQNPECSRATCRRCKKDDHAPKTCEEASVDKVLSARHLVEEARSAAVIRTCRKCGAPILKDFGCNKMGCTRCGSAFCYVCNDDITDFPGGSYNHFDPSKCILYDEPGYDRHEKEAIEAEKEAISKAKAIDADLDENQLRIDPEIKETRTVAMQNLLDHPAGGVFMRDINNRVLQINDRQMHMHNLQARVEQLEARRPDREVGQILAEARAMAGGFGMDNIPPPEVRLQQLRQLQDLQRRAREHQGGRGAQ